MSERPLTREDVDRHGMIRPGGEAWDANLQTWTPPELLTPIDPTLIEALRLHRLGVPERYARCSRDTWQSLGSNDPWEHLDDWLTSRGSRWSVVLLGPTGSGKTHLATALFREHLERHGGSGWWVDAAEALHQLREDAGGRTERVGTRIAEKLLGHRLLLTDDLLQDRLTDFAHDEWLHALNHRYNHNFPTIITSNAETVQAFDRLDRRVTSRLHDGVVIRLTGRDRRLPERSRGGRS